MEKSCVIRKNITILFFFFVYSYIFYMRLTSYLFSIFRRHIEYITVTAWHCIIVPVFIIILIICKLIAKLILQKVHRYRSAISSYFIIYLGGWRLVAFCIIYIQ